MPKRYITPDGFRCLEAELDSLWRKERPRVVEEVATAAAHGDRSENAEYIFGKKKLREIDRRIRRISKLLDVLEVVRPDPMQAGRVFFGACVTVVDEEGVESTYAIVGPDEIDLKARRISVESPMAKALIGKRVGDVATVRRPAGEVEVEIVTVEYGL